MRYARRDSRPVRRISIPILATEDRAFAIRHPADIEDFRHAIARRERFST
jgi:hypothetical protein